METEKEEIIKKKSYFNFILLLSIFIYFLYLEINPKIRGIWLRKGDDNKLSFTLAGIKNFVLYPFKDRRMWFPKMWDMNAFVSIPLLTGTLYLIVEYFNR
jgi:hypothetical protein